jgi:hypothetical protein
MIESNFEDILKELEQIEYNHANQLAQSALGNLNAATLFQVKKVSGFAKLETLIFLSVLEGEFYLASCDVYLSKIKSKLTQLKAADTLTSIATIETMLFDYEYLKDYIVSRSSNSFQKKIFNFEIERKLIIRSEADYNFLWLFSLNVKLAEIDEGYSSDERSISMLLRFYHDLNVILKNKLLTNQISVIFQLKLKCSLLLFKIIKRLKKTEHKDFNIYNDSFTVLQLEEEIKKNKSGKNILAEIKSQYFDYNYDMNEIEKLVNGLNPKIVHVHKFTKYIKKKNFSSEKREHYTGVLKNLLLHFKVKLQNIKSEEHKYMPEGNEIAYRTTINLIVNSIFCLESQHITDNLSAKFSYSSFEESYKKLNISFNKYIVEEDENIPNFIIYKIYIEQLIKIVEICKNKDKKVLNEDGANYEEVVPAIFDDLYLKLRLFKEKLLQSKEFNLMPLYLEIEDCNKDKFFLDSQHILPSNYNHLMKLHDGFTDDLKRLERIIFYIIPTNIKESLKEVFKKEVKEHQYSVITIIGLYASFITYVLANVNILPDLIKHSMGAVFAFMLVLGVVLFFFVGTLKLLFSTDKYFKVLGVKIYYFLLWLIAAVFITFLALCKIEEYSDVGITNPENRKSNYKVKTVISNDKNSTTTVKDSIVSVKTEK